MPRWKFYMYLLFMLAALCLAGKLDMEATEGNITITNN